MSGPSVEAAGLNFPTSVTFSTNGTPYVAESGLPFAGAPVGGRIWRIDSPNERTCLLEGLRPPVNGILYHQGGLILSEGGRPGRISRFDLTTGNLTTLVDNLPGFGNYQTNMTAIGPDGKLYFSQGAMTNSGVIGLDSHDLGWLRHVPHHCDLPGYGVVLREFCSTTRDPRTDDATATATTGAFAPFGSMHPAGHRIAGTVPCTSAVMRCNLDGSGLELYAWGLRNAYGIAFLQDGRLLATDQGADQRGSRPMANCPDALFEVKSGAWYGWPDFVCGRPVDTPEFALRGQPPPEFVLANHSELPPPERPLFEFEVNCAALKFDVIPHGPATGQLLIALFGDERPMTGPAGPRVGRSLLRLDPRDWAQHPVPVVGLRRPIDVRFAPNGDAYIVDFGEFEINPEKGIEARAETGSLRKFEAETMKGWTS